MESWNSRRSSALSKNGICASSQPLASAAGVKILQNGGNAADAAVAMAAALNVTEPCSTGIGGDAFALYYDASTRKVSCLQGNGRSSSLFSLDLLKERGIGVGGDLKPLSPHSGLCITVPGAAALWEDLVTRHGKLKLSDVLKPAIELAEDGFPIHTITAKQWCNGFLQGEEALRVLKPNGRFAQPGDIVRNPDLAMTFRTISELGVREGFYSGRIAEAIVQAVALFDGVLTLDDLQQHRSTFHEPVSSVYKGVRVYETPPPTHGLAVLIALGLIEEIEKKNGISSGVSSAGSKFDFSSPDLTSRGSVEQAHLGIECMRLAFADALQHFSDPEYQENEAKLNPSAAVNGPAADDFLTPQFLSHRANQVNLTHASEVKATDFTAFQQSDTVYFCVVDKDGNACSMINSNYMGFGSGIVPTGCGFTLHNRGHNFSLVPGHPNAAAPRKRPYNTIIPGLMTNESDGSLYGVFGNMGGFMQPMGHLQLVRNLIDFKMDPQSALNAPRWYLDGTGNGQSDSDMVKSSVSLEQGYGGEYDGAAAAEEGSEGTPRRDIAGGLRALGHVVGSAVKGDARKLYGRGQIILRNNETGVLWGGSDPRADGCAMVVP